jgi:N-acetylneuraminic acid mutarotase
MAYANGHIYMFGGELQPRVPVPAATYVYDLANSTWSKLETAGDSLVLSQAFCSSCVALSVWIS